MYLNDRQFESVLVEHCQWQDHAHSFIVLPGPGTSSLRCQSRGRTRRTRERPTNPFVCAYLALAAGAEIKINMWHWLKLAVLFCQNLQLGLVLLPAPCSDCGFPALWHPLLHNFNLFSPLLGFFIEFASSRGSNLIIFLGVKCLEEVSLEEISSRFPFPLTYSHTYPIIV